MSKMPTASLFPQKPGQKIVRVSDLKTGLPYQDKEGLKQLFIILADVGFLRALSRLDESNEAVATVMEAWAVGISLHIVIHRQMLRLVPVTGLAHMPLQLSDHEGRSIEMTTQKLLSYSDVALLENCWLLTPSRIHISEMAADFMSKNHIQCVEVN